MWLNPEKRESGLPETITEGIHFEHSIPVLVIDLSPESVAAIQGKARYALQMGGFFRRQSESDAGFKARMADAVLAAIGIKGRAKR